MKHIVLMGNASWLNRGCEAIEVSTIAMLRRALGDVRFTVVPFSTGDSREATSVDHGVRRLGPPEFGLRRYGVDWVRWRAHRKLRTGLEFHALESAYESVAQSVGECDAVLSVGGDNYSSDYGRPNRFWALNSFWARQGIPVYLWGASIGPFPAGTDERIAAASLRSVTRVFARETDSVKYLRSLGLTTSVSMVMDPAFTLEPAKCIEMDLAGEPGSRIGINLSSLFGRYTNRDDQDWLDVSVQTVTQIARATGRDILLVPHVALTGQDDSAFLTAISERLPADVGANLLPGHLGARELKACISRCAAFVGARTHATIAALSSGVPTVSLAYSMKAHGINRDLFGHTDFLVSAGEFSVEQVVDTTLRVVRDDGVASLLTELMPRVQEKATSAARCLAEELVASR